MNKRTVTPSRPAASPRSVALKRYSIRLPLHLASRVEALCEMYPEKTRTDLLADLLGMGLARLERAWPRAMPSATRLQPENRRPIYLLSGPFAEFHGLTHKHHTAMARELARDEPEPMRSLEEFHLGDLE